ncbi:MAG TPA: hypothetical protein VGR31_02200 [Planctomycetota bacterium]|jgi:DNA-3-methyladenine glycosylase II|nr:hypothetical protein [Planctomycetota bacterium]
MPKGLPADVPELAGKLSRLGAVGRFRNPSLWDALAIAVIRQVIRAGQAAVLYRAFCAAYGGRVDLGDEEVALFPSPEIVLGLTDRQFTSVGMAFKRRPLRAVAEAYLKYSSQWQHLSPAALVRELQRVSHVGAWTAGAAVADWSNDFALYPYADLAVRTWAGRAAPSYPWPVDEVGFGQLWRRIAGDHLSSLTLLTLAWGKHHGDNP